VKYFLKSLYLFLVFLFSAFALSVEAGPRPGYTGSSNGSKTIMLKSFPGNFFKPSPGGAASLKNYTSVMPAARLDSSFSSLSPYPTNKWYTSLFTDPRDDTGTNASNIGNRVALTPMLMIYDSRFPYGWDSEPPSAWGGAGLGYSLGGQLIGVNGANEMYVQNLLPLAVQGSTITGEAGIADATVIWADKIKIKDYSDWSVTTVLEDRNNSANKVTTTFGKGFAFTYNYFSPNITPRLRAKFTENAGDLTCYISNNGTMTNVNPSGASMSVSADSLMLKMRVNQSDSANFINTNGETYQYFGVYAPSGSTFHISKYQWGQWKTTYVNVTFPASAVNESDRYLSIALLKSPSATADDTGAFALFQQYYNYAYNFVTDTQVSWTYNNDATLTTNFNFTFDVKRSGGSFVSNQTIFALYPHHYKNLSSSLGSQINQYSSIRGTLKAYPGSSFQTKHNFNGIVPFLTYEVPASAESKLQEYLNYDKDFDPSQARIENGWKGDSNTYYHGKAVARAANLISVFHQNGDFANRDSMINRLKTELSTWYSGTNAKKYFGYDSAWGGIIGSTPGNVADFGASKFNDHHFHYGYFVYASAILAIYDPSFAESSQYKGMVDLLIKEFANPLRDDTSFPFLRNFDVYEGHSWANGRGGADAWFGNDEESTSEAMNAWAGIYLWGIVTNNQTLINLGVYGYTTQYEATKNYYFNIEGDIWTTLDFNHKSVGMLFDSKFNWSLWWDPKITQTVMGIQVLPLTPSMLYLGYDTNYAQNFYNEYWSGRDTSSGRNNLWRDIWLRFESLFDAPKALTDWNSANLVVNFPDTFNTGIGDDGSSMSFSYHFIHFFNAMGTVDTNYYANEPSFLVTNKSGVRTFIAYNPDKENYKTVNFFKRTSATVPAVPNGGSMMIPPGTMVQTDNFSDFKYTSTDLSYSPYLSSNTKQDVYSIYSDNFLGGVVGGNEYQDNLEQESWGGTISFTPYTSFSGSFEGENYMSAKRTDSGWGGWGFSFADGMYNMSSYYGGKIEVSLRISSPSAAAENFEIGFETIGGQVWFTLSELGFVQSSTDWQSVSIPLKSDSSSLITKNNLGFVTLPFIMRHNAGSSQSEWGIEVFVDSILWKKAAPLANLSLELANRSDGLSVSSITWDNAKYKEENAVSLQYIEIALNNVEGNNWGVQVYTDNKSSFTVSDLTYAGEITSTTNSGLVNLKYNSLEMLPIRWRPAPSSIEDSDVFTDWQDPWKFLRDISAFDNNTGLHKGSDEIKFMDKRGFRYNYADYGSLQGNKKIRLYFIADFRNAIKSVYKANIIIEYFNE
jgi:endoglucanase Acf2